MQYINPLKRSVKSNYNNNHCDTYKRGCKNSNIIKLRGASSFNELAPFFYVNIKNYFEKDLTNFEICAADFINYC